MLGIVSGAVVGQHQSRPRAAVRIVGFHCGQGETVTPAPDNFTEFDVALATAGVPFKYPEDGEQEHQHGAEVEEALAAFLVSFTKLTPLRAGQRLHALAFLAGVNDCNSNRELARRLKLSEGRVSQILADLHGDFASLSRLRRRNAKGRKHQQNESTC